MHPAHQCRLILWADSPPLRSYPCSEKPSLSFHGLRSNAAGLLFAHNTLEPAVGVSRTTLQIGSADVQGHSVEYASCGGDQLQPSLLPPISARRHSGRRGLHGREQVRQAPQYTRRIPFGWFSVQRGHRRFLRIRAIFGTYCHGLSGEWCCQACSSNDTLGAVRNIPC